MECCTLTKHFFALKDQLLIMPMDVAFIHVIALRCHGVYGEYGISTSLCLTRAMLLLV
jgi:hypothetical protein